MLHGGKYALGTFVMAGILTPVIFFHSADARVPKKGGDGMHVIKIVDPSTVGDLMRPGSDDATSGRATHQRVISKPRDGSIFLGVMHIPEMSFATCQPAKPKSAAMAYQ